MRIQFNTLINHRHNPLKQTHFKGFDCPEDNFEVKRLYNIPCPICSIPMVQKSQVDSFVNSIQNKKGAQLIDLLNKYSMYFHETEKEVAEILIQEAIISPSEDITALAKKHLNKTLPLIEERQVASLEKIKKYISNLHYTNKANVTSLIDKNIEIVKSHGEKKFVKTQFIKELNKLIEKSYSIRKKIMKMANKVPDDNEGAIMFLIKYANKTKAEFASRLLTPSLATCEHIRPKSAGGKNNTANYLAQCEEDNSKREERPFSEWLSNPALIFNLRRYFDVVSQKLETGELSTKYGDYLSDISKTISSETGGRIELSVPKQTYLEEQEVNLQAAIKKIEKKQEINKAELKHLLELKAHFIDDEEFSYVVQIKALKNKKEDLMHALNMCQKKRNNAYAMLSKYRKKEEQLEYLKQSLAGMKPGSKEYIKTKNGINKIKNFLLQNNYDELKKGFNAENGDYVKLKKMIDELESEIYNHEAKITSADEYRKNIASLNKRLSFLYTKRNEIANEAELNFSIQRLDREIDEKEKLINCLKNKNQTFLIFPKDTEILEEYHKLQEANIKIEDIKNIYTAHVPKKLQTGDDIFIYKFTKNAIKSRLEYIEQTSDIIKRENNLKQIEKIKEEIRQLTEKKQKLQAELQSLDYAVTAEEYDTEIAQVREEIENQTKLLSIANDRLKASLNDTRIEYLKKAVRNTQNVLDRIKNRDISERELRAILKTL